MTGTMNQRTDNSSDLNYIVIPVVYGDEDQCSDTLLLENAKKMNARFTSHETCIPNDPYCKVICTEKDFKHLISLATGLTSEEVVLEDKALLKHIFPQGGIFILQQLTANLGKYFTPYEVDAIEDLDVETASYLSDLCHILPQEHIIMDQPRLLYRTFKADHRSYAGATFDGDRRTPGVASHAIRLAILNPFMIDFTIAGMRLKDNKYRNIFMDSFANYFREAMFLHNLFEIWRSLPFDSNKGDLELAAKILRYQAKSCYGGDYSAMDQHWSYSSSIKLMNLLYVWFKLDITEVEKIKFWLKDLHEQAVLVGDKLWVPKTTVNLFSGLYPTHDFEGMGNTLMLATSLRRHGFKIVTTPRKLRDDEAAIIVCGDDSIVLFGREIDPKEFGATHAEQAAKWNQEMELSKVEFSTQVAYFCKKAYSLRDDVPGFVQTKINGKDTRIPKYSLRKAMNSLYHPENYPKFTDPVDILRWAAMILDNCAGNKQYKQIVKIIVDKNPTLFSYENVYHLVKEDILSQEFQDYVRTDWWTNYVYDPYWKTKSFTCKFLAKMFKID